MEPSQRSILQEKLQKENWEHRKEEFINKAIQEHFSELKDLA